MFSRSSGGAICILGTPAPPPPTGEDIGDGVTGEDGGGPGSGPGIQSPSIEQVVPRAVKSNPGATWLKPCQKVGVI